MDGNLFLTVAFMLQPMTTFRVLFMMLSVPETVVSMVGRLVNDELERISMEAVMAQTGNAWRVRRTTRNVRVEGSQTKIRNGNLSKASLDRCYRHTHLLAYGVFRTQSSKAQQHTHTHTHS